MISEKNSKKKNLIGFLWNYWINYLTEIGLFLSLTFFWLLSSSILLFPKNLNDKNQQASYQKFRQLEFDLYIYIV